MNIRGSEDQKNAYQTLYKMSCLLEVLQSTHAHPGKVELEHEDLAGLFGMLHDQVTSAMESLCNMQDEMERVQFISRKPEVA